MRIALKIVKYLIGLAILFLASGFLLPATYSAERSISIAAPIERVFPLVANQRAWKDWSVWNQRDPQMQLNYSGPEMGKGAKWSWVSKSEGNGSLEFTDIVPNQRIDYTLTMEDMKPATGDLRFKQEGSNTVVSWRIEGNAGMNPLFRWFGYFMDKLVGPDFTAGLTNLKKLAEASAS